MIEYERLPETFKAAADTPAKQDAPVVTRKLTPDELARLAIPPVYYRRDPDGSVFEADHREHKPDPDN